jgi:CheY-like chemotaxis protein
MTASEVRCGTVLVVDDSSYARLRLRRFLNAEGWESVVEAADWSEALARAKEHRPVLILLDQIMRGKAGVETARLLRESDSGSRIVMLTAVQDRSVRALAEANGVEAVLQKNDWEALRAVLNR